MAPANYLKVSRKYDIPIYCGDWAVPVKPPTEENEKAIKEQKVQHVLFAGGGGDRKHGINNRIVLASFDFEEEELSEEVYHLSTGDDPAFQIAVHPSGDCAVAAFEDKCRLYEIDLEAEEKLVASERRLQALEDAGEQKFLVFSPDGTRLAAGGEDKRLRIFEWPSMKVLMDVQDAHKKSLKDADFSVDGVYLATTADFGPCHVWEVEKGKSVATLNTKEGKMGLCRFSRDVKPFLFTTVVRGGKGWLVVWNTQDWSQLGVKKFHEDPISAFAVSKDSKLLATGTAGGEVAVIEMKKMVVRERVKNAHMVFVTGVQFSPNSRAVLSVSGDSSARVTIAPPPKEIKPWQAYAILLLMFLGSILLAVIFYYNSEWFFRFPMGRDQPSRPPPEAVLGYRPPSPSDPPPPSQEKSEL